MKKRLFSLFLVCSMLASVFGMSVWAAATEGVLDDLENIQVTHTGGGHYKVTFDVKATASVSTGSFQVFTQQFFDDDGTGPDEVDGFESGGYDAGDWVSTLIDNIDIARGDTTKNQFTFQFDPSVYNVSGTTYYLFQKTDAGATVTYSVYNIDTEGNIARDPMAAPTIAIASAASNTTGGIDFTITPSADSAMVDHYEVVLSAGGAEVASNKSVAATTTTGNIPIDPAKAANFKHGVNVTATVKAVAKADATKGSVTSAESAAADPALKKFANAPTATLTAGTTDITVKVTNNPGTTNTAHYTTQYKLGDSGSSRI